MLSNGNSISTDIIEDTIKNNLELCLFLLFLENLAVVLGFLTFQDKHNISTLSEDIKFICTYCETKAHFSTCL